MDKTSTLLELAERIAKQRNDGHLTIMRFTNHWKVCFGTPNLDTDGRAKVERLKDYETLEDALFHLLNDISQCGDCSCGK